VKTARSLSRLSAMPEITYAQTIMECLHNDVAAADINYSTNALANLSLHAFSIHFLSQFDNN